MNRLVIIWILFSLFANRIIPQAPAITFGQVSLQDLETAPLPLEKGANATVLCDLATAYMIYNNGFKIEYNRHIRIKIFNPSGYGLANIQIPFTKSNTITGLKAFTHNMEDDQPVRVAVSQKQFYTEKVDPYHNVIRFTFPNIREGSVIEVLTEAAGLFNPEKSSL